MRAAVCERQRDREGEDVCNNWLDEGSRRETGELGASTEMKYIYRSERLPVFPCIASRYYTTRYPAKVIEPFTICLPKRGVEQKK